MNCFRLFFCFGKTVCWILVGIFTKDPFLFSVVDTSIMRQMVMYYFAESTAFAKQEHSLIRLGAAVHLLFILDHALSVNTSLQIQ